MKQVVCDCSWVPAVKYLRLVRTSELCPVGFGISPGLETLKPLWTGYSRVLSPWQQNSIFLCLKGISFISICAHCISSLSSTGKSLALSHLMSFSLLQLDSYTHNICSKLSHLHPKQPQCSQHISVISISPLLDTLQCVYICLEGQL